MSEFYLWALRAFIIACILVWCLFFKVYWREIFPDDYKVIYRKGRRDALKYRPSSMPLDIMEQARKNYPGDSESQLQYVEGFSSTFPKELRLSRG